MSKLKMTAGVLALLGAIMVGSTTPAYAAFEVPEAREGVIKLTNSETATSIKISEPSIEVKCEKIKGEGAAYESRGFTGATESENEVATGLETWSPDVLLTLRFENCKAGEEAASVATERCAFELYQQEETEPATVSLRAAESKKLCHVVIEAAKCRLELSDASLGENEELSGLNLKNKSGTEVEVERGEVTGMQASIAGECKGHAGTAKAQLVVAKALVLSTVQIPPPPLDVMPSPLNFGSVGLRASRTENLRFKVSNLFTFMDLGNVMINGDSAGVFQREPRGDTCSGALNLGGGSSCVVPIIFSPRGVRGNYGANVRLTWTGLAGRTLHSGDAQVVLSARGVELRGEEEEEFAGISGGSTLKASGEVVACAKDAITGELTSTMLFGNVIVHYLECKSSSASKSGCEVNSTNTSGKGLILTNTLRAIVGLALPGRGGALLLLPASGKTWDTLAANACTVETKVTGSLAGLITPTGKSATTSKITFAAASGKQDINDIDTLAGLVKPELTAFSTNATEETAEEITWGKAIEVP